MSRPWQQLSDLSDQPVPVWAAAGAAVLAAAGLAVIVLAGARRTRPARTARPDRGRRLETVLTVGAAGIATGVSSSGMWRVFGDALHMSGPARVAVFGFVELAVAVSAIRARRAVRETGSTGVDGAAVWVLAGLSAALSALDADSGAAVLLRLAAPLVAAWLWERGLAPDRRQLQVRRRRGPVAWRVTRERVLVWLRLAEPAERAVAEVHRARKIARLTRAAWRYHSLTAAGASSWRVRRAAAVLRRHTLAGVEHLALGEDAGARDAVRRSLATLYQVIDGTAPGGLADLTPWAAASTSNGEPSVVQSSSVQALDLRPSNGHERRPVAEPQTGDGPEPPPVAHNLAEPLPVTGSTAYSPHAVQPDGVDAGHTASQQEERDFQWSGESGTGQSARAELAARDYRGRAGALPTTTELARLANVSRGTAGTVLKILRTAHEPTSTSTSNDRNSSTHPASDSDTSQQQSASPTDQTQTTHQDHPTHDTSHKNKIQYPYTPMHHDPEEDQLRDADAPAGTPSGKPDRRSEGTGTATRPAGDPVGVG